MPSPTASPVVHQATAPSTSGAVWVGMLWVDTDNGRVYTCTSVSPVTFTQQTGGVPTDSKSITVESPTSSEDISIFFTPVAVTVTEMRAVLRGSATPSVTWTIRHHATDRNNAGNEVVTSGTTTTSTTSGDDVTAFNDATIPADSFVWLETTAQSGTVNELHITIVYTED